MSSRRRPLLLLVAFLALAGAACGTSEGAAATSPTTTAPPTTTATPPTSTTVPVAPDRGPDGTVDDGMEVAGDGYQGWILDPDAYAEVGWLFTDTASAPTAPHWLDEDHVAAAEALLADDLVDREAKATEWPKEKLGEILDRLDDYDRQYLGARVDGAQLVHVNALCTEVGDEDAISRTLLEVMDGGSCFWNATIDLTAGEVVRFSVNGDA